MDIQTKVQLQIYLRLFYSKRWFILSFVLIVLLGTILYLENVRPKYESFTTILIDKSVGGVGSQADLFSSSMGLQTELENHMEHLRSYTVSEKVYEYLEQSRDEYPIIFEVFNENNANIYPDEKSKILFLMSNLKVEILNRKSDIIKLTTTAYSPEEAKFLADIYQNVYQSVTLDLAQNELNNLNKYLITEQEQKETLLSRAEEALNTFKQDEGIKSLSRQTDSDIDRFATMKAKRESIQIEIEATQEAKRAIDEQLQKNQKAISSKSIDFNSSYFNKLAEKMAEKKIQRDDLELKLKSNNISMELFKPRLDQFDAEIKNLQNQLDERLKITSDQTIVNDPFQRNQELQQEYLKKEIRVKELQKQLSLIDENLSKMDLETSDLPKKQLQLLRLERTVAVYEKIYNMLVEKRQENEVLISAKKNNIRLIDRGRVDRVQVFPKKALVLGGTILVSLGLSLFVIFLVEYLDNTVKSEEELKQFSLKKIGVIPNITLSKSETELTRTERLFIHDEPRSVVAESFRAIRTNILFQIKPKGEAKQKKSFLLTSCGPQEGKSTTICNLAISFAEQGLKTVVIDSDLRRPVIHSVFGGDKNIGFSNYLYGEKDLKEILNKTKIENLFTINSGIVPPNPSELLSSEDVGKLITELEVSFDIILFDTPPIIAVTDASILASKVDATMIVIRASKTDRDMIPESISKITLYDNNLMGCILNDFNFERHYGYKYQYYNYYGKK
jgi:tyrosine-protein kinase Etk/Wzc